MNDNVAYADLRPDASYMFERGTETMSRDALAALQLDRLKTTVRRAYESVAHYRRAFEEAGIVPDDVRSPEDVSRLPFTTKADLRDHYPFGMFAVPRAQLARLHASSGTTGKPTVVGYTAADLSTWAALMARRSALRWCLRGHRRINFTSRRIRWAAPLPTGSSQ